MRIEMVSGSNRIILTRSAESRAQQGKKLT